ncbi:MAG: isoprenylcysteine carboxylmethyltransferase family protein [Anaerolineae bacterium]
MPARRSDGELDVTGGIVQRLIQLGIQALLLASILFLSSGRLDWVWAWVYVATFVAGVGINGIVLCRKNPELIAERAEVGEGTQDWDRVLTLVYGLLASVILQLVAGLDKRFGWSPSLPVGAHLAGLVLSLLGYALASWAMIENAYFAGTVRIQAEQGHTVCTSGPYQVMRHPGYTGWAVGLLTVPLLLGSLWSLIPGGLAVLLLVVRTMLEDRLLREELDGDQEYAMQVRHRLVPGIW